jgi:nitrous oxidase accessory protein
MQCLRRVALSATLLIGMLIPWAGARAAEEPVAGLQVCATCQYATIVAALTDVAPGGTIQVRGGTYAGPLAIGKPVRLEGIGGPVIDGRNRGTVVHITAPDVTLQGFIVRDSGDNFDREDSAVLVEAPRAALLDNQFLHDLFGANLRQAPDARIERNTIVGKPVPAGVRGDAIKVWYSHNVLIAGNRAEAGRDILVWYSDNAIVRDNSVVRGRYGLHIMNSNDNLIERNRLEDNSVGIYLMYGRNILVRANLLRGSRGPSGQGLGLKEVDAVDVEQNIIVDNRVGIYIDNSPLSQGVFNHFRGNLLAYNDSAIGLLPSDRNSVFNRNNLIDNLDQVTVLGGGRLGANQWSEAGAGNFWSDYVGYDANEDGIGDIPFRDEQLSEQLMDTAPILRLFRFSVASVAVDFAARTFPLFRTEPTLTDPAPLTAPAALGGVSSPKESLSWPTIAFAILCLGVPVGLVRWGRRRTGRTNLVASPTDTRGRDAAETAPEAIIALRGVTKRYGDRPAVDGVSLTVKAGEALALWGANGAGKTTLLRCLLGSAGYEGEIAVAGHSPLTDGIAVRRQIGYVPQEMPTFDLTVGELTGLIARLRGIAPAEALGQLGHFGLAGVRAQPVASLSGGMKQKLALTLALLGDPPILLLDEPTANLDAQTQDDLLRRLQDLKRQGRTLIFTSHRWREVRLIADRVVYLDQGRQVEGPQPSATPARELVLRVGLDPQALDPARDLLRQRGFTAHRNGKAVLVSVAANRKAEPLLLLASSGYAIADFDLEDETGE